jgi:hypothetical protein
VSPPPRLLAHALLIPANIYPTRAFPRRAPLAPPRFASVCTQHRHSPSRRTAFPPVDCRAVFLARLGPPAPPGLRAFAFGLAIVRAMDWDGMVGVGGGVRWRRGCGWSGRRGRGKERGGEAASSRRCIGEESREEERWCTRRAESRMWMGCQQRHAFQRCNE